MKFFKPISNIVCLVLLVFPTCVLSGNLNASINSSRTSGVAPLAVYFDGSQSSGLSENDVLGAFYSWDFGDSESGTWLPSGNSKNLATGFLAAHVFEQPGKYTVTMQIQDTSGQTSESTVLITVQDPEIVYANSTRCVSTSGNFIGAPANCELITSSDLASQVSWINSQTGRRLLLRGGESWIGNIELTSNGPCTLASFGSDSQAIIYTQNSNQVESGVRMAGNDCRLIDIEIDASQGTQETGGDGDGSHNLALRINSHDTGFVGWGLGGDYSFLVDSRVEDNGYFSIYTEGVSVAILGSYIDQIRVATSFIRPLESKNVVISDNHIDASREEPTTGIKWHGRRGVITANKITAGTSRIALSNSDGIPTDLDVDTNLGFLLIERNRMENNGDLEIDQWNSHGISFALNTDVMVRNNLIIDANIAFGGGEGFAENVRVMHNTVLMTNQVQGLNISNGDFISFNQSLVNFEFSNNIISILASIEDSAYPESGVFINLQDTNGITLINNLVNKPDHEINNRIGNQFYDFNQWMNLGIEQGTIQNDPAFISVDPNSELFMNLSSISPAIDSGINRNLPEDYLRSGRPQDGNGNSTLESDIGAIEYNPSVNNDLIFMHGFEI